MAELTAQQKKEMLENMFKEFLPEYNARFAGNFDKSAPFLQRMGRKMYSSESAARTAFDDYVKMLNGGVDPATAKTQVLDLFEKASSSPFNSEATELANLTTKLDDGTLKQVPFSRSALGSTAGTAANYVKAHPGATFGTALNTGAGIAGLLDNDKFGGQLIGTAAGAILPAAFKMGLSPLVAYNVAMGAGNLGALFDTLRAKKEQQKQQQQQYYGG